MRIEEFSEIKPTLKSRKKVCKYMDIEDFKNLPQEEKERIIKRNDFKNDWKMFHDKYKQLGNSYQRAFLNAFYDVKDGVELCEIKGVRELVKKINTKNPKASAYLSFISENELNYLIEAFDRMSIVVDDAYEKGYDMFKIQMSVYKVGTELRNSFYKEFGLYPKEVSPYEETSNVIIKQKSKNSTFTSKPKEKVIVKNAEVAQNVPKAKDVKKADDKQSKLADFFGLEM